MAHLARWGILKIGLFQASHRPPPMDPSLQPNHSVNALDIEAPPFLGTWPNVYVAVVCYLAALIGLLYAITRLFTY